LVSLVSLHPLHTLTALTRSLRAYYALAVKLVLQWQLEGDSLYRQKQPALLLTAGAAWLLNGLHSALDKGASSKQLMKAILPHIDRQNAHPDIIATGTPFHRGDDDDYSTDDESGDDGQTVPAFPFGMIFMNPIQVGDNIPVPRLINTGRWISPRAFRFFFGCTLEEIGTEFFRAGLTQPAHPSRVPNKAKRTPAWHNHGQASDVALFDLSERGIHLQTPPRDGGSDISEDETEPEGDIDAKLTRIWHQFLLDLTMSAPNPKRATEPSYCKLSTHDRKIVTEATYRNKKLSTYFTDVQWKIGSEKEWNTVFDRFFTPKDSKHAAKVVQNYTSSTYLPLWEALKSSSNNKTTEEMRSELKKRFNRLYWVPFAQSDRIWYTKFNANFEKSSGLPRALPAPQVLVRNHGPTW
jgi:hypothetical protein